MQRLLWLPMVLLLTSCGKDAPPPVRTVRVPRVAEIWKGTLPPGPRVAFTFLADGSASLDGERYAGLPGTSGPRPIQGEPGVENPWAGIRTQLAKVTADDALRTPDGASKICALIQADARVPWGRIRGAMGVCASPDVQIYRLFLHARREADEAAGFLPWILPRWAHGCGFEPSQRLVLKLFRRQHGSPGAYTLIKLARQEFALPPEGPGAAVRRVGVLSRLKTAIRTSLASFGETRGTAYADIRTPPPKGPFVPFGDVAAVLGLLLEAGVYPDLPAETVEADLGYRADGSKLDPSEEAGQPIVVPFASMGMDPERGGAFGRIRPGMRADPTRQGLDWLAAHQAPDGSFPAADFGAWCDSRPVPGAPLAGAGDAAFDVGVTGLAISAFLTAGYTNRGNHPYKRTLSRALRYLKNKQDPEGCFGARAHTQWIYNHAAASLAMTEAYGMTRSPIFKGSAQRSIGFIERCRNPGAVWRYGVRPGDNDTSVTGWMLLPLASARMINEDALRLDRKPPLVVDDASFAAVASWLDKLTDEHGRVGYASRGSGSSRTPAQASRWPRDRTASLEALGLYLRFLLGAEADDPALARLIERVLQHAPTWKPDGSIDMAFWRFGSLALWQLTAKRARPWERALREAVAAGQRQDGVVCTYKGSWDPVGPWGASGGRVYATAMILLCLEAPRGYARGFGR